ncbi:hypothetical protein PM082_019515 [Marasmius tenuissimus]|nr:hypothetical protein PM082_019515 [Marasmius tenuissimus]
MSKIRRNDSLTYRSSDSSSGRDSAPPSSPSRTPSDATVPIRPHIMEPGSSGEEHEERVDEANSSNPQGSTMLLFPGYSYYSVQNRLEDLLSRTTDFKTLTRYAHFRDRSAIIDLTQLHRCTLLRAPHGYGKTSIVSMLSAQLLL